jgi:asparagine synthase (glutamine-hydrolysing)
MCGLAASVVMMGSSPGMRALLPDVAHALTHRGPDHQDYGIVTAGLYEIGYVHTRLAIIEPDSQGNQPFRSKDGRWMLLFNGEIYNYIELRKELELLGASFETASDTEVLLNAWIFWGADCLPKLNGMFAFAVLDFTGSKMFVCRDSFGMKPLYWSVGRDHFSFGSEVAAVCQVSGIAPKLNHQVAHDYLAFGSYDRGSETFLEGISSLNPGCLIEINLAEKRPTYSPKKWFEPVKICADESSISLASAIEMTRNQVIESVRLHLRSDVQLGVALSGGLDSSVIATAAKLAGAEDGLKSFSFASGEDQTDESVAAAKTARFLGLDHTFVRLSDAEIPHQFDREILGQGEPFGTMSVFAQSAVYRSARDAGVRVMLDGQGGDEVFAGYDGYPEYRVRSLLSIGEAGAAVRLVRAVLKRRNVAPLSLSARISNSFASSGTRQKLVRALRPYPGQSVISARSAKGAYGINLGGRIEGLFDPSGLNGHRYLANRLEFALNGGDLGNLLRHADRSSMSWSVESRLPFLNRQLVNTVSVFPEDFLLSGRGETKFVLRQAFSQLLPQDIIENAKKIGFEAPDARWIRSLSPMGLAGLDSLSELGWVNRGTAQEIVLGALENKPTNIPLSWRLINLARWMELNSVQT